MLLLGIYNRCTKRDKMTSSSTKLKQMLCLFLVTVATTYIFLLNMPVETLVPTTQNREKIAFRKIQDCTNLTNHWVWENSTEMIVPLFGCSNDNDTNDLISYFKPKCNHKGYLYSCNHKGITYYLPPVTLKTKLTSRNCSFQVYQSRHQHIFTKNKLWIHLEGDSVMRDNYYDYKEYFTNTYKTRVKIPHSQSFTVNGTLISFSYNPSRTRNCSKLRSWRDYAEKFGRDYPNVWVYNMGLHDLYLLGVTPSSYVAKLKCLNKMVHQKTLAIFKFTTPSAKNHTTPKQGHRIVEYNELIWQHIDTRVWKVLDTFSMLYKRRNELTTDGVHYTGLGSKWISTVILDTVQKYFDLS